MSRLLIGPILGVTIFFSLLFAIVMAVELVIREKRKKHYLKEIKKIINAQRVRS